MREYQANPACRCGRCSSRGWMTPVLLVTLGVLFLLANRAEYPVARTWPVLLIVIGATKVTQYLMPDHAHRNPGEYPPPYARQNSPVGQQEHVDKVGVTAGDHGEVSNG